MSGFGSPTMTAGLAPPPPTPPPAPPAPPPTLPSPQQAAQVASLAGAMFAGATTGAKNALPNAALAQPQPGPVPPVTPPQIPGVVPGAPATPSDAMMQKLISDSKAGLVGPQFNPAVAPTGPTTPGGPQPPSDPTTLGDALARLQADRSKYEQDSSNAPQYKPPNKWLELATARVGLAFPAGGIGKFAAGLSGGLAQGAQQSYQRKEEQWKDKQTADEKAMGLDATLYDAQAKIDATAQENAIRNDLAQQRIGISENHLQLAAQGMNWKENVEFPANQKRYYDLAQEHNDVIMRGQDFTIAGKQMGIAAQYKLEGIRQIGMNSRAAASISERQANTQIVQGAETARAQYNKTVATIQKVYAKDPATMASKITEATAQLNDTVNGLLAKAPPGSDMANLGTLGTRLDADTAQTSNEELSGYANAAGGIDSGADQGYSPSGGVTPQTQAQAIQLSQKGYTTDAATGQMYPPGYQGLAAPIDANTPPGGVPTGQPAQGPPPPVGAGAPGTPIDPAAPQATNPAEQHGINLAQQQSVYQLQLGAEAQKLGVGGGVGVDEASFKGAREFASQHAADYPTLQAFVQAMNGPGGKLMSNPQAGQLVELWAHTRRAQGLPVDVPPPPGQTPPHPTVPGSGPASLDITKPNLGLPTKPAGGPVASTGPGTPPAKAPDVAEVASHNPPATAGLPPQIADAAGNVIHAVQGAIGHATPTKGEVIQQAAKKTGVPEALLIAIAKNESNFNNDATSLVGAHGMFQLMPGTAKALGVDPNNPVQNVMGGATYIAEQLKRFHSIPAAIAAYNAGPQAVIDHRGIPPFPETRAYVQKVLRDYRSLLQEYPIQTDVSAKF